MLCVFFSSLDILRLKLENSIDLIDQLSILSSLTVNISSCVLYDRIQAAESIDKMEIEAKSLYKSNELFGSKCYSTRIWAFLCTKIGQILVVTSFIQTSKKVVRAGARALSPLMSLEIRTFHVVNQLSWLRSLQYV